MNEQIRVAFFPDSFLEVNGVAMTSNRLVGYAKENGYPFLCIHAGEKTETRTDGSVKYLSLKRSPVAFPMDEGLKYDPLFQRHVNLVLREMLEFKPDVFHITGLNDVSIIGSYLAWKLKIPMVASWHTNLHEYAARRLTKIFKFLPKNFLDSVTSLAERKIMDGAVLYYKMPKILLAPNQELIDILHKGTKREARLMIRGVDTIAYTPEKRMVSDNIFRFGYVGRLRAEKNVRLLVELEKALLEKGKKDFKFLIVGEGNEREYLEKNLKNAEFTGFLDGENLYTAYANMDVFIFPSETDAFGNVVQESNAAGLPCLVTDKGGPKFIVRHGETGYVCENFDDFVKFSIELMENPELLSDLKRKSRDFALTRSWNSVFENVYQAYRDAYDSRKAQEKSEQKASSN
ncbi:MAG TPA: glycosyltransferase [Pyrinomonadaceae bacterium]|nr:glycosyltransferase [Pyrinomonadaceae bacterium]